MSKKNNGLQGIVHSVTAKSLVVRVERKKKNALGKYVTSTTTIHVHDEQAIANKGDLVEALPVKPLSKQKTWKLSAVIENGAIKQKEQS